MLTHGRPAIVAPWFAPHRESGGGGAAPDIDLEVTSSTAGEGDVVTVGEKGRSIEAVIAALASVPVDIERLIEGKSGEELSQPAEDGGWGLVEILPHFRDWEEIIGNRVGQILSEEEPGLEEYDDSLWAIEHGYREQDTRGAFDEFAARRRALVERLTALEVDDWSRVGILPKRGRVTLHWLMNSVCNHDAKHVVQARDVLA